MARNRLPVGGRGQLRHHGAFIAAQIVGMLTAVGIGL
jgi:hypothetical protein